jgi:UDP-N-acetylglucosamine acyltransferase
MIVLWVIIVFSNNSTLAGHVTIGDNVILAGLVAVQSICICWSTCLVTGGFFS